MKKNYNYLISLVLILCLKTMLFSTENTTQTFHLKTGDKITGTVIEHNTEKGVYNIKTEYGIVIINQSEIKKDIVVVWLKNGDKIVGELLVETEQYLTLRSTLGDITIEQTKIKHIELSDTMTALEKSNVSDKNSKRYFYGEEQLMDLFLDPTGFTLAKNTLYVSGLSVGYGITDRLQVTSRYWESIFGESLNVRFKYKLIEKGNLKKKQAFAIGTHLHLASSPNRYYTDKTYNTRVEIGSKISGAEEDDGYTFYDYDNEESAWTELFAAYSQSILKKSERGRHTVTTGFNYLIYPGFEPVLRAYAGIDTDLRKDVKFIAELFYDPSWYSEDESGGNAEIGIDYGFIYNVNEKFRFGMHIQRPFLVLYYKF
ncbi:hypothetical protein DID76_01525 [Candidatus Marinamargulisbacteria bacterium SCGC AG-414-C22]|nr:hypothetical protein DID76_01525 [Candidatus Marinamargulisbacteria bacterium SCGC AG-414-C22]